MRFSRHREITLALGLGLGLSPVVLQASASTLARSLFASDTQQDSSNGPPRPLLTGGADLPWALSVTGRPGRYGPSPVVLGLGWHAVASGLATYSRQEW